MNDQPIVRRIETDALFAGADGKVSVRIGGQPNSYTITIEVRSEPGIDPMGEQLYRLTLEAQYFERVMAEVAAWKRAVAAAGDPRIFPTTAKIAAE